MIRGVLGWKCRGTGPLISLPDYVHSFRAMEPSSSSLGRSQSPHHAQQQEKQQQRNHRTNEGNNDSVAAGAKPRKGSFGGAGSACQNSLSQLHVSPKTPSFQFGTVGLSDGTPSYATNSLSSDFPQLSKSNVGEAPVSALRKVTAGLDKEHLGNGSKLESKASPLPVEGTSARVPNTKSQVTPKCPSKQRQWGSERPPSGSGEGNKDSVPVTSSPSIDDSQFPPLSASSAAGNRKSSRKGRSCGTAEQVRTPLPSELQELKQTGEVDSPASVQRGPGKERQRNFNQNRQSVYHDRGKARDGEGAELRNGREIGDRRDGRQNRQGRDPTRGDPIDTLGRALTRILRHQAVQLKLDMSSDGYVDVQDLLKLSMKTMSNRPLSSHRIDDVKQAVRQDNKQRFGIKEENGRLFIRANQGHTMESVKSEHLLNPIISADEVPVCVHGTYRRYLDLIFKEGLKRMERNHVHFASGVPGSDDVISGMRSTSEVLIYLNVNKALADGMKLYFSENKVILTEGFEGVVPPEYFKEVLSLPDMTPIAPPSVPA